MNAGIITQARMTSTRLPGKVLMSVREKPLLGYHIDRLRQSNVPVIIATTVNETDDPVVAFAQAENIPFYRGSEDNVLSRYYEAAKEHKLDIIVRVTSDCPLIDGALIGEAAEEYALAGDDWLYLSNCLQRTFPRGFDFEIFSFRMLEDAYNNATQIPELEHVTPYINQNRSGKVNFRHILYKEDRSDIRITVDMPEDFELVKKLIEEYNAGEKGYEEIISVFDVNPGLKEINAHIEQKKL